MERESGGGDRNASFDENQNSSVDASPPPRALRLIPFSSILKGPREKRQGHQTTKIRESKIRKFQIRFSSKLAFLAPVRDF